jgi:prevent-host-death family protein
MSPLVSAVSRLAVGLNRHVTVAGGVGPKAHLTRLLDRVAAGEGNTITRHDTPIARLVPVKPPSSRQIIKDLIDEGRR